MRSALAKALVADRHGGHWGQSHLVTDEGECSLLEGLEGKLRYLVVVGSLTECYNVFFLVEEDHLVMFVVYLGQK